MIWIPALGVNGAAAKRPRKGSTGRARSRRPQSVNGAAAKRPRKGVRSMIHHVENGRKGGRGQTAAERTTREIRPVRDSARQWGRGQTAAERGGSGACRPARSCASMGPRPNGRGKFAGSAVLAQVGGASMGPRPNGRGKAPRTLRGRPRPSSVNGAAAKRPRKVAGPDMRTGRAGRASMGPRPNGRGKLNHGRRCAWCLGRRQWGRGQTAAESDNVEGGKYPPGSVNGAAAKRPRKGVWVRFRSSSATASMGPRPNGRGKLGVFVHFFCGASRQWGRGQTAAERT